MRKTRRYRKRRRAEQEQRTRERIAAAAAELHGTVGPARTTISGIAEKAGVQRATVYRHFPTEAAVFQACTAHYMSQHPPPDPAAWDEIADPSARLRRGLADMYRFYEETESMMENTSRDLPLVPSLEPSVTAFLAYVDTVAATLLRGRSERGAARRRVAAAIGHAVAFPTWQSLVRAQGLDQAGAVAVMAAMVEAAGGARP